MPDQKTFVQRVNQTGAAISAGAGGPAGAVPAFSINSTLTTASRSAAAWLRISALKRGEDVAGCRLQRGERLEARKPGAASSPATSTRR